MCIYVYMCVYIGVCPCGQIRKAGGLHHSCPSGHASLESDLQRSKKKIEKKRAVPADMRAWSQTFSAVGEIETK